jgi:hypothetical protein
LKASTSLEGSKRVNLRSKRRKSRARLRLGVPDGQREQPESDLESGDQWLGGRRHHIFASLKQKVSPRLAVHSRARASAAQKKKLSFQIQDASDHD